MQPVRAAAPAKAAPAAPAPKVVRGPTPAAKATAPARAARVTTQAPLRVAPVAAPQRVVRAAPAAGGRAARPRHAPRARRPAPRSRRAGAAPKPASPTRTASRRPAAEREGLSRGNVSLIGVFGGESGRHALLLMPDGSVERVRPGDRVRGAQVAAIDSETVRLSGGGRDTLLRLPD